jgi:hypothetical protein
MPSYPIPPHLACPLSGEPLVEPVVLVGVHAPEKTPTLRLGETVDLQSLRDMFKNGSTGALSAACSFVRNRTIESAIEDFACQKLAESLPISSLQEGDVHPTVAAVLGQILAQHELAAWHDRARELALTPSRESLTALAAIMARKNQSWKVMQIELFGRQGPWQGQLFVWVFSIGRVPIQVCPLPIKEVRGDTPLLPQPADTHGHDLRSPGVVDGHHRHGEEQDPGQGGHPN